MKSREKLYKIDIKGNIRVWWMEYDGERYRTCSGIQGGAIVESGWQFTREKNVGRANATTLAEQVESEVNSRYEARMYQGKYHSSIEEARKGAKFIECMLAEKFNPKKTDFPYYSQPKLDGCLTGDTIVYTENGEISLSDLFNSKDSMILSYNVEDMKVEYKRILGKFKNAIDVNENKDKKWLMIKTNTGKAIKLTADHRVFLPELNIWREAKDIKKGDKFLIFSS